MGAETPSSSAEQTAADRSEVQMKGIPMTVGDLHRCVRVQLASATDGSDGTPSQFHEDVLEPYIGFLQFLQERFRDKDPDTITVGLPPRELMNYQRDRLLPDFSVSLWLRSTRHGQEYKVPPYTINRLLQNFGAVLDREFRSLESSPDEKDNQIQWEELVIEFLTQEFYATSEALDELAILHPLSGGYTTLEHILHQLHDIGAENPDTSALFKEIVARAIIYEMFETYLNNWHTAQKRSEQLAHWITFARHALHKLPATLVATAQTGHPWYLPIILYLMFENFGTRRKESGEG